MDDGNRFDSSYTGERYRQTIVVCGLKPEVFKEEMFSRSYDTLVEVMAAKADLVTYRDMS